MKKIINPCMCEVYNGKKAGALAVFIGLKKKGGRNAYNI